MIYEGRTRDRIIEFRRLRAANRFDLSPEDEQLIIAVGKGAAHYQGPPSGP